MSFFESEFVKKEMQDITELQEKIYESVFKFHSMSNAEKLEHVEMLEDLLNKQKILYTRLSLSDDPQGTINERKHHEGGNHDWVSCRC